MEEKLPNNKFRVPKQLQKEGFGFVKIKAKSKKPLGLEWQKNPYNLKQIEEWIQQGNNYGVMGGCGGLIVIDADAIVIKELVEAKLPPTFTVRSRENKRHFYYICPELTSKMVFNDEVKPSKFQGDEDHYGEIISGGSQVVGAGSIHPKTNAPYEVINDIEIATVSKEIVFSVLAEYLKPKIFTKKDNAVEGKSNLQILDVLQRFGIPITQCSNQFALSHPIHGSKNGGNLVVNTERNVWYCFRCETGGGTMSLIAVLEGIIDCSQAVEGGLRGENFLRAKKIACDKYGYIEPSPKAKKVSKIERFIEVIKSQNIELFHDQFKKPFAILHENKNKVLRLSSREFKTWVSHLVWEKLNAPISPNDVQVIVNVLSGEACHKGILHKLHVRVAWHEEKLWYDLGDGNAVCIDKNGWEIIENPPTLFYNFSHQKAQAHPQKGGNLDNILPLINLKNKEEQLLLKIIIVTSFIPGFSHPIIVVYGPQGSAKSSSQTIVKEIVDPSSLGISSPISDIKELIQLASHHWVIFFDNLSYITYELSDAFCRLCTGGGFSKRELFSDDDDIIYSFRSVLGFNGINLVASRPDLLDRSVLLGLSRIPESARKQEADVLKMLEEMKPSILGGIFDTLVKTLCEKENVKQNKLPRMADFFHWGCAVTRALGQKESDFSGIYNANIAKQHNEAIEASMIARAIIEFMEDQDFWTGTPTDLSKELNHIAERLNINIRSKSWPQDESVLWKRINEVSTNLNATGIRVDRGKSGERFIILEKFKDEEITAQPVQPVQTEEENSPLVDSSDSKDSFPAKLNHCANCEKDWKNDDCCPHSFDADIPWNLKKMSSKIKFSLDGKKTEFFDAEDNLLGEYVETSKN